jgi:amidase
VRLTELSALEVADAVRTRQASAVDVTQACLERAEAVGPELGAFARLAPDLALAQARDLDARLARGEGRDLPLLGVPCPVKDLNPVAGVGWEAGSAAMAGVVAEADDDIVGWLRDAGTVMVGKTAICEFGLTCYTEPDVGAPARTPWDSTRSAGGSSGGAAAAVAAGIVPLAHGSDGGGSLRIPGSACGLVALKPSRGRIGTGSRLPGPGLGTDGVLSRTVRDTAVALDVLAGSRPGETYHAPPPEVTFLAACERPTGRLRVGVLATPVIADADVHPACLAGLERAARLLESLGHDLEPAPRPFEVAAWDAFAAVWAVGALQIPLPAAAEPVLVPLTRWLRDRGRAVSGLEYATALAGVQQLTRDVATAWDRYDLVLTPTLAQPPAPIGSLRDDADPAADFAAQTRFTPWTSVYNLSGRPAIQLPVHTEVVAGVELPIGIMLGGRFGDEATLLAVAAALEEAVGGWRHPWAH